MPQTISPTTATKGNLTSVVREAISVESGSENWDMSIEDKGFISDYVSSGSILSPLSKKYNISLDSAGTYKYKYNIYSGVFDKKGTTSMHGNGAGLTADGNAAGVSNLALGTGAIKARQEFAYEIFIGNDVDSFREGVDSADLAHGVEDMLQSRMTSRIKRAMRDSERLAFAKLKGMTGNELEIEAGGTGGGVAAEADILSFINTIGTGGVYKNGLDVLDAIVDRCSEISQIEGLKATITNKAISGFDKDLDVTTDKWAEIEFERSELVVYLNDKVFSRLLKTDLVTSLQPKLFSGVEVSAFEYDGITFLKAGKNIDGKDNVWGYIGTPWDIAYNFTLKLARYFTVDAGSDDRATNIELRDLAQYSQVAKAVGSPIKFNKAA